MLTDPAFEPAREMLLACAPEFSLQPLYLLRRPEAYPPQSACGAFALRHGCPLIRAELSASGEWKGGGPMIVFEHDEFEPDELLAVAVHEAAHLLPFELLPDAEPTAAEVLAATKRITHWADPPAEIKASPWGLHHGSQFIRAALHLHWRALERGYSIDGASVCVAGAVYGLSHAGLYQHALMPELLSMPDAVFSDILAATPPSEFTDLFDSDVATWRAKHAPELLTTDQ